MVGEEESNEIKWKEKLGSPAGKFEANDEQAKS